MATRVFLTLSSPLHVSTVSAMLDMFGGFELAGTAVRSAAAMQWFGRPQSSCDVLVVQECLPDGPGTAIVAQCRKHKGGDGRILMVGSDIPPALAQRYLDLGVDEVVPEGDFDSLAEALLAAQRAAKVPAGSPRPAAPVRRLQAIA